MSSKSQESNSRRAVLYVDGFNLYHPLCELNDNTLKWLNLWALGQRICQDRQHNLVGVKYCTAFQKRDSDQLSRHKIYINALEAVNVETVYGHYIHADSKPCGACGMVTTHLNEKQTDINLALSLFSDAMQDAFDYAYLLSADSDQAATGKFLRDFFPKKKLITVSPPNKPISDNVANYAVGKRRLNRDDIEKCRFPNYVQAGSLKPIRCPKEYWK
ncbi:NYN domain-containing protein [Sulfitobacter sp. M368]|uniref:NYN domain-containing protein n=1 Tax=Sulfitobacter sp. M368 TaxID=2867021 RepID=UPI0021A644D6|nr:NYN domain-containing protein [Sulfitobacter sp. M368]UWR15145.1 NYN domain-containing protein [Sulfitobacter sp. M368]